MRSILVGVSGGVDSAVSIKLLQESGYNVAGAFMKNWSNDDFGIKGDCPWEIDQRDAEEVCKHLGIEFFSLNFEKEYRERVVKYFFDEYKHGRTPNPDIWCNHEIKFDVFLKKALELGFDGIATGHYAGIHSTKNLKFIKRGIDTKKDQSYFLSTLDNEQISKVIFPLSELTKPEVRELAIKYNIPVAAKKDSQGICFIGNIDVAKFLRENITTKPGIAINIENGDIVGNHDGVYFYTIGQKSGKIQATYTTSSSQTPLFIHSKDIEKNILYLCSEESKLLYTNEIITEGINWVHPQIQLDSFKNITVQIRYRQKSLACSIKENYLIQTEIPIRAVTPGQIATIYNDNYIVGYSIIK